MTQEFVTKLWASFSENEKTGVRFGMFPALKMRAAETALALEDERDDGRDTSRKLAVALMDMASKNGGMRA